MTRSTTHITTYAPAPLPVWDLRDCYTESFPEFIPFCKELYFFSSYKDFSTLAPA